MQKVCSKKIKGYKILERKNTSIPLKKIKTTKEEKLSLQDSIQYWCTEAKFQLQIWGSHVGSDSEASNPTRFPWLGHSEVFLHASFLQESGGLEDSLGDQIAWDS